MIAATHAAFATAVYFGGASVIEYKIDNIAWLLAVVFSVMPDIDLPKSQIGRPLYFISVPLEKRFGHRTITHSIIGMGILAALAYPLHYFGYNAYFWAIIGGYWSHIQIDMANIRGVDLMWPSPIRVVMPGRMKYRIEVGSKAEMIVMCSLIVLCVALYPIGNMGLRGGLDRILQDFGFAHDEFVKVQGLNWHTLELKAVDNLTLEHISCECPVIGEWQGGLIIEHNGRSRSVGESSLHHNLMPIKAVLIKGAPLRVVAQRIDMRNRSLGWLVENLKGNHGYYLLGKLYTVATKVVNVSNIEVYSPVMYNGSVISLHYAKAEELKDYANYTAINGEIVVQFWLKPGDELVELKLSGGGAATIPEALQHLY
jgi:inner membrane protein